MRLYVFWNALRQKDNFFILSLSFFFFLIFSAKYLLGNANHFDFKILNVNHPLKIVNHLIFKILNVNHFNF